MILILNFQRALMGLLVYHKGQNFGRIFSFRFHEMGSHCCKKISLAIMLCCQATNQHQVIIPSWLPKVPLWLRKKAHVFSHSKHPNFSYFWTFLGQRACTLNKKNSMINIIFQTVYHSFVTNKKHNEKTCVTDTFIYNYCYFNTTFGQGHSWAGLFKARLS